MKWLWREEYQQTMVCVNAYREHAAKYGWKIYIPKFGYTTDNAAMIAITGYYKFLDKDFCTIDKPAYSRVTIK